MSDCNNCVNVKYLTERLEKSEQNINALFDRLRLAEAHIVEHREQQKSVYTLLEKIEKSVESLVEKLETKKEKRLEWLWGLAGAIISALILTKLRL